jgi:hypothetical protein
MRHWGASRRCEEAGFSTGITRWSISTRRCRCGRLISTANRASLSNELSPLNWTSGAAQIPLQRIVEVKHIAAEDVSWPLPAGSFAAAHLVKAFCDATMREACAAIIGLWFVRVWGLAIQTAGAVGNTQTVAAVSANAEQRAANLRAIVDDLRSRGFTSARVIAAQLNERGILTARGGSWHPTSAARLLSRLQSESWSGSRLRRTINEPHALAGSAWNHPLSRFRKTPIKGPPAAKNGRSRAVFCGDWTEGHPHDVTPKKQISFQNACWNLRAAI